MNLQDGVQRPHLLPFHAHTRACTHTDTHTHTCKMGRPQIPSLSFLLPVKGTHDFLSPCVSYSSLTQGVVSLPT
eukprot:1158469-Pelagomonas_calceolata.AAC.6